jgi:hypothetical protein
MKQNEHKEILLNINIEKSDEALKIADYAIREGALTTALNRIYYAVFYTVSAMAIKHDFITSKHAQMLGWFNKKFVYEEKIFSTELGGIYKKTYQFRQRSDYDTEYPTDIEQAKELLADAKVFIKAVRKEIDSHGSIE